MSLADENLRFALLKAIADAAAEELGKLRNNHLTPLLERFDGEGTTSYKVKLPDGAVVGTVSLTVPKDAIQVTDDAAFLAWLKANHPDAVEEVLIPGEPEHTIVVPATEDRTETVPNDKRVTAVMKQFKVTDDGIVDTATGAMVAGATLVKGERPKSFAVKYDPDGREQLAAAYRAGKLDEVVAGTSLPAVGQWPVIERRLVAVPGAVVTQEEHLHSYTERAHFPPAGAPHGRTECPDRGCPISPDPVPVAPPVDGPDPAEGHGLTVTSVCDCGAPIPPGSGLCCGCAAFADEGEFDPGDWDSVADQPTSSGW